MIAASPDANYLSRNNNIIAQDSTTSLNKLSSAVAASQHDSKMTNEVLAMAVRGRAKMAEVRPGAGLTITGGSILKGPTQGQA